MIKLFESFKNSLEILEIVNLALVDIMDKDIDIKVEHGNIYINKKGPFGHFPQEINNFTFNDIKGPIASFIDYLFLTYNNIKIYYSVDLIINKDDYYTINYTGNIFEDIWVIPYSGEIDPNKIFIRSVTIFID